jgi:hypothetical protein
VKKVIEKKGRELIEKRTLEKTQGPKWCWGFLLFGNCFDSVASKDF